ncbi:MAG: aminoglycoside phosphotransferase family protein [Gammaproteobacteria bacterium]|jgi:Ser/Thr protein kinase RdoA (MazF antagonist)|nr:aminoglycoside phosphotransferase family protein [Gammaproteobacteria bacterium]
MNPGISITSTFAVAREFDLPGRVGNVRPHGRGLINDTYVVDLENAATPHAILQRISRRAFPRPDLIMENLSTLFAHAEAHAGRSDLLFPFIYRTRSGALLHIDEEGSAWRAMSYIEGTRSHHRPQHPGHAREAGRILGRFHALLFDLDPSRMHDTRPDFHNTPRHLARLNDALAQAEPSRLKNAAPWLDFIDERRSRADLIERALVAGTIRPQVVHGDPKLDNVLFDAERDVAVSLIDLDTVKPGVIHHDIADCLRSCCNRAGEAGTEGEVAYELEMCSAGLAGYFEAAGDAARSIRTTDLFAALHLIPFELGVRFLADHLAGDRYFRIDYPGQNLARAATQLQLSLDVERKRAPIEDQIEALL